MRNILRVIMLVLIAAAVYFVVTFLIASNDSYQKNATKDTPANSGEMNKVEEAVENVEASGEEAETSGEVVEETSGELEEDVLAASDENSGEIENEESTDSGEILDNSENKEENASGEIIENAIVDPSGDYQYEKIENDVSSGEQEK